MFKKAKANIAMWKLLASSIDRQEALWKALIRMEALI